MVLAPHTPLVLLAAIAASSVAFFIWFFRDAPGAKPLAVFMVGASLMSLADGVSLASPTLSGKVYWTQVAWTAAAVIPLAWLATVLSYTDHRWKLTPRRLALLLVEPLLFVAFVWTNGEHSLVWRDFSTLLNDGYLVLTSEFGLVFWAHVGYSYLLVAIGGAVLVQLNFHADSHFRNQYTALLVAVFVPMVTNALSLFRVLPPHLDLTSVGFVVTGVVITGAVVKGELLSITPTTRALGREAVVDEMDDQMLILDGDDRVVELNPAAERLLGVTTGTVVGERLADVHEPLATAVDGVDSGQVELEFDWGPGVGYFDVRVSPLFGVYGTTSGRVVSLRDVTERRRREQRLDVLNRLLRHNLRNEMNVVGGNAELLRDEIEDTDSARKHLDHIEETVAAITGRSEKIGRLERHFDRNSDATADLGTVVPTVATSVRSAYPDANISVDVPEKLVVACGRTVEVAVEELVINALEHNETPAPAVDVTAETADDGYVTLRVSDDGPGIPRQERTVIEAGRETALEHGSGVGLWMVAWVVEEYGGTVSFECREDGTTVALRLPDSSDEMRDDARVGDDENPAV